MSAIDIIKRRLKEDRVPDAPWPDELGEKKKRPREVAFMDVNLCFAPPMTVRYIQTRFRCTSTHTRPRCVRSATLVSRQSVTSP